MSSAVALLAQGIAVAQPQGGGTATVVQLPAEQVQQQQQQPPPAQQQQQHQQQASTSTVAGACRHGCASCARGAGRYPFCSHQQVPPQTRLTLMLAVQSTWSCD